MNPIQKIEVSLKVSALARMVDRELTKVAGEHLPFSLFIWNGDQCQYVSNVEREDAMALMQEVLDRWKRYKPDLGPPHEDGQEEIGQ